MTTGAQMQTSNRRLVQTLRGERLDPPPIWLMRQAGRYLPEYRATREEAGSFLKLCFDSERACKVTLQPIERFGFDAAILFADILLIPLALGQKVWFEAGEGPRLDPIAQSTDLTRLDPSNAQEELKAISETVRLLRDRLPSETALIGFAGAPWTVATYMIAGRGTKDQEPAKLFAYKDPQATEELMELLVDVTTDYLSAQVAAGAEVIQLFDTWAGGLSPQLMDRCVLKPTKSLVAKLKDRHPDVPVIGFPRGVGAWGPIYVRETGVDALSLGTGENLEKLLPLLPNDLPVQGGLDPLLLCTGGEALWRAVDALLDATKDRPYIFNLGHGIVPQTDPELVGQLVRYVRGGRS